MTPISFLRDDDDFARIPSTLETDASWKNTNFFRCSFPFFFSFLKVLPLFIWEGNG